MLNKLALSAVRYLFQSASPEEQEQALYGCEILLYTVFSTLGLLITGLLFSRFLETVCIVSIFYVMQSTGGGYHAHTHSGCL